MILLKCILSIILLVTLAFLAPKQIHAQPRMKITSQYGFFLKGPSVECGQGATLRGNDNYGTITVGVGTVKRCNLIFSKGFVEAPSCTVSTDGIIAEVKVDPVEDGKSVGFFLPGINQFQPDRRIFYHCLGEAAGLKKEMIAE